VPRDFRVRYDKVMEALEWLKANNPLYGAVRVQAPPAHADAGGGDTDDARAGQSGDGMGAADARADDGGAHDGAPMDLAHSVVVAVDHVQPVGAAHAELQGGGGRAARADLGDVFQLQRHTTAPASIITTLALEALCFVLHFPYGRNHMRTDRHRLHDSFYIRQRVDNVDPRFRNDPMYLAWAISVISFLQLRRCIGVALRFRMGIVTAGQIRELAAARAAAVGAVDGAAGA